MVERHHKPTRLNRRGFLKTSGLAAGGLTITVSFPMGTLARSADNQFVPNAFIHIAEDGATTLYCGRCEMGQGISTALPAAVADELEADWQRVSILQGDADEKYGPQATGGSRSINVMLEPMRQAGAAGREMLVAAAAQTWGLPVAECHARNHVVFNDRNQRELPYGELVALASTLDVPEDPVLKNRDEFRYIGKPLPRHDQGEVVVGKRVYGADVKLPGMKYGAITHVPVYGGSLKSLDTHGAEDMPGVVQVVEVKRFEQAYGSLGGVAVVADDSWTAQRALKKLEPEWNPGPHGSYDTETYKQQLVDVVEQPGEVVHDKGDTDHARSTAATRHSATYVGGHLSHSPMEPMASAARVTDERCEIWASTQDPQGIQRTVGAFLGREPKDIVVHVMMAGGGFGRKFKCDYVQEAVALSQAVGAPVQLTWSREEDTRTGYYHSCSAQHMAASMDDAGQVTGWLHRAAFPTIGSLFNPEVVRATASDLDQVIRHPYGIENLRVESGLAKAHTRIGWWRAVYAIFYGFAINGFTDELAHKAGIDTVTYLRNLYDDNADPELKVQSARCRAVLDKAAAMAGWGKELDANHGMGVAVHHSFESYVAMVAQVEVDGDRVTVHRVDCAVDCGLVLNPEIATAQMEGAVIMGIGLTLNTEITFKEGAVVNSNFHDYPVLRMNEAPAEIHVAFIGQENKSTGLGEPGVPTLAPALVNAIYAASGKRYRSLPIERTT